MSSLNVWCSSSFSREASNKVFGFNELCKLLFIFGLKGCSTWQNQLWNNKSDCFWLIELSYESKQQSTYIVTVIISSRKNDKIFRWWNTFLVVKCCNCLCSSVSRRSRKNATWENSFVIITQIRHDRINNLLKLNSRQRGVHCWWKAAIHNLRSFSPEINYLNKIQLTRKKFNHAISLIGKIR